MNRKVVGFVAILASLLTVFLIVCLLWAMNEYNRQDSEEIQVAEEERDEVVKDEYKIVALGDSLTRGTGDESGSGGYIGILTNQLKEKFDNDVRVLNLAVNGAVSAELMEQVKQKEVQRQLQTADTVLLTIGGNDLFQQGETILHLDETKIGQLEEKYLHNLKSIISDIRNVNQHSTIFLIGLYNPFIEIDEDGIMNQIVRQWNFETAEVLASFKQVVFVPTFDLFQLRVNDYLYSDKFHPNAAGYRLIAERVAPLIEWEAEEE